MDKKIVSARELSEELEVSIRTVYRDVDKLSLAGIPVITTRGKGGGISILPEYILNKAVLSEEERTRMLSSLQALGEVGYDKVDETIEKLGRFFGSRSSDWIEIEFSHWTDTKEDALQFQHIKTAILSMKKIVIDYATTKETTKNRVLEPYKLCYRGQDWYLYAYCQLRQDFRFFKLKRIQRMEILEESFKPREVGKVLHYNHDIYKNMSSATIAVDDEILERITDDFPIKKGNHENGRTIVEVEVTDVKWLMGYAFQYGKQMEIIEPKELRQQMRELLRENLEQYII